MGADDIVERLRALSRCEHSDLSIGDEAAAEIVRLRGEAEQLRVQLAGCGVIAMCNTRESLAQQMPERGAYGWSVSLEDCRNAVEREMALRERLESIAPAEAKGDACPACKGTGGHRWHEPDGSEGGEKCEACNGFGYTPQPADGGAVAPVLWVHPLLLKSPTLAVECSPVKLGPAQVPLYLHPAVDALGAVRECHMRGRCECIGACKYGLGGNGAMECPACRLEATLQHRGDSRGGEG